METKGPLSIKGTLFPPTPNINKSYVVNFLDGTMEGHFIIKDMLFFYSGEEGDIDLLTILVLMITVPLSTY